jgi:integrase
MNLLWAARLQYGAGLRLSELVRLRVKDVATEGTESPAPGHQRQFSLDGMSGRRGDIDDAAVAAQEVGKVGSCGRPARMDRRSREMRGM